MPLVCRLGKMMVNGMVNNEATWCSSLVHRNVSRTWNVSNDCKGSLYLQVENLSLLANEKKLWARESNAGLIQCFKNIFQIICTIKQHSSTIQIDTQKVNSWVVTIKIFYLSIQTSIMYYLVGCAFDGVYSLKVTSFLSFQISSLNIWKLLFGWFEISICVSRWCVVKSSSDRVYQPIQDVCASVYVLRMNCGQPSGRRSFMCGSLGVENVRVDETRFSIPIACAATPNVVTHTLVELM